LQPQGGCGQVISRGLGEDLGEAAVDVDGQVAGLCLRELENVVTEQ
jgi:hypothetical protein